MNSEILSAYARVLVCRACGNGKGVCSGDRVVISHNQGSADFVPYLVREIVKRGGYPVLDTEIEFPVGQSLSDILIKTGNSDQIDDCPTEHLRELYGIADHRIVLRSPVHDGENPFVNSPIFTQRKKALSAITQVVRQEMKGYPNVLAYYPTETLARQSGVTLDQFWEQVRNGCYLDAPDPVASMQAKIAEVHQLRDRLNALGIERIYFLGDGVDLEMTVPLGPWCAYTGNNFPSFECFTSVNRLSVNGQINFSYPIVWNGITIDGIELTFKEGKVIRWSAKTGSDAFAAMLAIDEGASFVGEIALTDKRISLIDRALCASLMYLENIGGTMHLALGNAISYTRHDGGDPNNSSVHQDMVMGGDFEVDAQLQNGHRISLFKNGQFVI